MTRNATKGKNFDQSLSEVSSHHFISLKPHTNKNPCHQSSKCLHLLHHSNSAADRGRNRRPPSARSPRTTATMARPPRNTRNPTRNRRATRPIARRAFTATAYVNFSLFFIGDSMGTIFRGWTVPPSMIPSIPDSPDYSAPPIFSFLFKQLNIYMTDLRFVPLWACARAGAGEEGVPARLLAGRLLQRRAHAQQEGPDGDDGAGALRVAAALQVGTRRILFLNGYYV